MVTIAPYPRVRWGASVMEPSNPTGAGGSVKAKEAIAGQRPIVGPPGWPGDYGWLRWPWSVARGGQLWCARGGELDQQEAVCVSTPGRAGECAVPAAGPGDRAGRPAPRTRHARPAGRGGPGGPEPGAGGPR